MMSRLVRTLSFTSLLAVSAVACMDDGKAPEEELDGLEEGGKADTIRKPTEHGYIFFDLPDTSALTADARFHAWQFDLSGDARVDLTTSYAVLGQRRTDTVLYLYKKTAAGTWGSYIARNDDFGSSTYSQLKKDLGAGSYRVLVKGALAATTGKFKITTHCTGDGCAPPTDPNACLFGDAYYEIIDNPAITIINSTKIYPATLNTLTAEQQHQLLLAVKQSAHDDVTTPAEAIAAVDQEEVNVRWMVEPAAQRAFISFEYGSGDNSYGAIFSRTDGSMVTNIHDGDLENCTVKREVCTLPDDWNALKSSTEFVRTTSRVVTQASQLTGVAAQQAVIAFQQANPAVTTVAEGLADVDDNEVNVVSFRHTASGKVVDVYEFGAGDTSVGAIFYAGTTDRAAIISDLAIDSCTFFNAN